MTALQAKTYMYCYMEQNDDGTESKRYSYRTKGFSLINLLMQQSPEENIFKDMLLDGLHDLQDIEKCPKPRMNLEQSRFQICNRTLVPKINTFFKSMNLTGPMGIVDMRFVHFNDRQISTASMVRRLRLPPKIVNASDCLLEADCREEENEEVEEEEDKEEEDEEEEDEVEEDEVE